MSYSVPPTAYLRPLEGEVSERMRVVETSDLVNLSIHYNPFGDFARYTEWEKTITKTRRFLHMPWDFEVKSAMCLGLLRSVLTCERTAPKGVDYVHGYIIHVLTTGLDEGGPLFVQRGPPRGDEMDAPIPLAVRAQCPRTRGRFPAPGRPQRRRVYSKELAETVQAFFSGEPLPHKVMPPDFRELTYAAQEAELRDLDNEYHYMREMDPMTKETAEGDELVMVEGHVSVGHYVFPLGEIVKGEPRQTVGGVL